METAEQAFEAIKNFVGFTDEDAAVLARVGPVAMKHQPTITDGFYERILQQPELEGFVKGRVEQLKQTHARWFSELFAGRYDKAYFESRQRIGMTHVRIGLRTLWVDAVMTIVRTELLKALGEEGEIDGLKPDQVSDAVIKILDLDLAIVNLSYQEDRIDRLSDFTGMSKKLIENIINLPPKKPG